MRKLIIILSLLLSSCCSNNVTMKYPEFEHNYKYINEILQNPDEIESITQKYYKYDDSFLNSRTPLPFEIFSDYIKQYFSNCIKIKRDNKIIFPDNPELDVMAHRIVIEGKNKKIIYFSFLKKKDNSEWYLQGIFKTTKAQILNAL